MQRTAPSTRSGMGPGTPSPRHPPTASSRPGQRLQANELAHAGTSAPLPCVRRSSGWHRTAWSHVYRQRGARVASPSIDEAVELYELRILLEPLCLRQSLEASDDDHRREIKAAFEAFRSRPDRRGRRRGALAVPRHAAEPLPVDLAAPLHDPAVGRVTAVPGRLGPGSSGPSSSQGGAPGALRRRGPRRHRPLRRPCRRSTSGARSTSSVRPSR